MTADRLEELARIAEAITTDGYDPSLSSDLRDLARCARGWAKVEGQKACVIDWTRAHDAHIARECEGLDVWVNASDGALSEYQDNSIPHYLTDSAAAIRAVEAWVSQKPKKRKWWLRRDGVVSAVVDHGMYSDTVVGGEPAAALAQALYRATGGPA